MTASSATKELLMDQLRAVYITRGYDGATLAHLAHASGLSKAALYHHFPGGKPEMAATLVRHTIAGLQQDVFSQIDKVRSNPSNATKRLHTFLDRYAQYIEYGDKPCLLCILTQHNSAADDLADLQQLIAEQTADWLDGLAQALESAGLKPKRASRLAESVFNTLYGSQITAKMLANPKLFTSALKHLRKSLDAALS